MELVQTTPVDPRSLISNPLRPIVGIERGGTVTYDIPFGSGNGELSRWIWFNVTGNVNIVFIDGTTLLLKNVAAGIFHPIICSKISSTNTTVAAADILWGS